MNPPSPDFHLQLARLGAQIDVLQHTLQEVMRHGVLLQGERAREKLLARDQYLALEAAIREQELRDSPALRAVRSVCAACATGARAQADGALPDGARSTEDAEGSDDSDDADRARARGVPDSFA
ncbi:hypothetical protein [Variovorax sp.]|uniref:hypothetical protein n=1 Tax=Variovorax sp. TaxID=1871043 RepID=UPI001381D7FA|nr:hypothetical protein [Variovorax sp.]KAF1067532.1 MAG: hypothetical protein GAK39_04084 [Variovorax sp.]